MKQHRHQPAYQTGVEDMASIIAQETSGVIGAIPEQEDNLLAEKFIKQTNERYDDNG
jgi:phage tail sheath protein FI